MYLDTLYYPILYSCLIFFGIYGKIENRQLFNLIILFVIALLGFRPNTIEFVDMRGYGHVFDAYGADNSIGYDDKVFNGWIFINKFLFNNKRIFYVVTAAVYTYGFSFLVRKYFDYNVAILLLLYSSFSFVSYGTNGLRSGFSAALFMVALWLSGRKRLQLLFLGLSVGSHVTQLFAIFALYLSRISLKVSIYVALIFLFSGLMIGLLGFGDLDYLEFRGKEYLIVENRFGRIDFLIYSIFPLFFLRYGPLNDDSKTLVKYYLLVLGPFLLFQSLAFANRWAWLAWQITPLFYGMYLSKNQSRLNRVLFISIYIFLNEFSR